VTHAEPVILLTAADTAALNSWWFNHPDWLARQGYDHALITTQDMADARQLVQPLTDEGFEVTSIEMLYILSNRSFKIVQVMLGSIGGLALLVASIGVMNTIAMAIFERTREIGVLKALGATNRAIRRLFIFEAGLIGALGGIIGSLFGWLASIVLNYLAVRVMIAAELPPIDTIFIVTWWLVAIVIGVSILISVLAGVYPSTRAARLDPVTALSHE
jgi:ABC-type antimicrobial peptide transport system permease subunit